MKKKNTLLGAVLAAAITVLLGAAALFTAQAAAARIARSADAADLALMQKAYPGAASFTYEKYTGGDGNIDAVYKTEGGYVVRTTTHGYVNNLTLYVGVDAAGTVQGVSVRTLSETPGLGERAETDADFLAQFAGKSGTLKVGDSVDALSGATVTSKAVTRCVNSAIGFVTGADAASSATGESGSGSTATTDAASSATGESGSGSTATTDAASSATGESGNTSAQTNDKDNDEDETSSATGED